MDTRAIAGTSIHEPAPGMWPATLAVRTGPAAHDEGQCKLQACTTAKHHVINRTKYASQLLELYKVVLSSNVERVLNLEGLSLPLFCSL